jgi:OPA family sugar phosphate sensor protein UhpC-like MFS transporter
VVLWGLNGWFQSLGAPGGVVAMTGGSATAKTRAQCTASGAPRIRSVRGLTFLVVGTIVAVLGGTGDS